MNESKSARYHRQKRLAGCLAVAVAAGVLALAAGGGSVRLCDLAGGSAGLYALLLGLMLEAATLPLAWHRTFRLERQYGLSVGPAGGWLRDHGKGAALTLGCGAVGAELLYAAMRAWPAWWWLAAAAGGAGLAGVLMSAAPVLVLPLFHPSRPVRHERLGRRVLDLSRRAGIDVPGLHEWRVGERSGPVRATLAGAGATRRILLSPAMLAEYPDDEIEAVIAHEIGHHVHHDLWKGLLADLLVLLAGCVATAFTLDAGWRALGLSSPSDIAGLPVVLLVLGTVWLLGVPLRNALSRRSERRADRFALTFASSPEGFIGAVRRTAARNLAEEWPSRAAIWLFHTHPPVEERIAAAREEADRREARAEPASVPALRGRLTYDTEYEKNP